MTSPSDRRQASLAIIDEMWWLHEHRDPNCGIDGRCTALVVDARYVVDRDVEMRLAVSYGDNPFTENMRCGFVPPPVRPGTHVFGIHQVGTRDSLLTIYDHWFDARQATGSESAAEIEQCAREILASITDDEYASIVRGASRNELLRSADRPIEAFEILRGEAL